SFNAPLTTVIYTLSLHDALPIFSIRCESSGGGAKSNEGTLSSMRRIALSRTSFDKSSELISGPWLTLRTVSELETASVVAAGMRSEEHTSELQSRGHLVCRLLLE